MGWHRVEIRNSDVAGLSAQTLIQDFAKAYRNAGLPADASVYHCVSDEGNHRYYFSPAAVAVAEAVLIAFAGTPCPDPPDLAGCKPVPV